MSNHTRIGTVPAILAGGAVVGVCDMTYACTFWYLYKHAAPTRVMQSVAAGVMGRDAFTGGNRTAALGLALHFFIAINVVLVYWLASRAIPALVRRPLVFGPLYGLAVYFFMTYVVVALSAAPPPKSWSWTWFLCSLAVHALFIGTPAALFARMASRRR